MGRDFSQKKKVYGQRSPFLGINEITSSIYDYAYQILRPQLREAANALAQINTVIKTTQWKGFHKKWFGDEMDFTRNNLEMKFYDQNEKQKRWIHSIRCF
jgi:hypothetical protein